MNVLEQTFSQVLSLLVSSLFILLHHHRWRW